MKPKNAAFIYVTIALLHTAFIFLNLEYLRALSKVVLMPALGLYAFTSFKSSGFSVNGIGYGWLAVVLFFSWLGDIFLINDDAFLIGLGSFLIAQLGYTFIFLCLRNKTSNGAAFFTRRLFWALAFLFFGGAFFRLLYPVLLNTVFLVPVGMYTSAITAMGLSTALRSGRTSKASYLSGLLGAILFISSDAMIAISVFLEPFAYHQIWVMLTYIMAQFLLVYAITTHKP